MNYGGGLVAGDHVEIDCDVGPGCTVAMTTQVRWFDVRPQIGRSKPLSWVQRHAARRQGSTKIYKTPPPGLDRGQGHHQPAVDQRTVQCFRARVAAGATLALLPDPYTCFQCVRSPKATLSNRGDGCKLTKNDNDLSTQGRGLPPAAGDRGGGGGELGAGGLVHEWPVRTLLVK